MALTKLINRKLDLPYSFEEIDMQIRRAHRASVSNEQTKSYKNQEPQPVIAQFVNCSDEEIRSSIIYVNATRKFNIL